MVLSFYEIESKFGSVYVYVYFFGERRLGLTVKSRWLDNV